MSPLPEALQSAAPRSDLSANGVERISASIVLYNTPESQLERLLKCLRDSTVRAAIYIVDNSPRPLTYDCIRKSGIVYIRPETNGGYGAGHNIALRRVLESSDYHFVLNPDIYFDNLALEEMLRFMGRDITIGQLMPKVIYPDGSIQYLCKLLPTPFDLFLRRFAAGPLRKALARRANEFELRHTSYDSVMDVPYLSGCFMLFRTSALRRTGIFDERFFMYPEDIDITRRVHVLYRTVYYPGATVVHDHARESYKSLRALWIHMHNLARYFNKWGWLLDSERSRINRETLERLRQGQASQCDSEGNVCAGSAVRS